MCVCAFFFEWHVPDLDFTIHHHLAHKRGRSLPVPPIFSFRGRPRPAGTTRRQEKTLKIIINHFVNPKANLEAMVTSEKAWVHRAQDFSDPDEPKEQTFAMRFKDAEQATQFKDKFEEAKALNAGGEAKAADAAPAAGAAAGGDAAKGGDDTAAIDAAIAARNSKDAGRRKSNAVALAHEDDDYDSDEEDVDETCKDKVKKQYGTEDKSVLDAAAALEGVKVDDDKQQ